MPHGRAQYDAFPINAYEAETRHHTRFNQWGHTPGSFTPPPRVDALSRFIHTGSRIGPMAPSAKEAPGECPHTLDLRRQT
ncbi:MAG: transglutaminase family protein [Pseudomonadota bacterium]